MSLGLSNPNGETFVDYKIDPVGANNAFGAGITSGFSVVPKTGMTVSVGGETGVQDSAIVKATSGVIYPVGNPTGESLDVEIDGAPSTNSRIDAIVLSVDTTSTTSEINGEDLISVDVVKGTSSASPTAPSVADITSEIGAGKAFIVLATVNIPANATDITSDMIEQGAKAKIGSQNIDLANQTASRGDVVALNSTYKDYNTLVAPADGTYLITFFASGQKGSSSTSGSVLCRLYLNTNSLQFLSQTVAPNEEFVFSASVVADAKAGDTIKNSYYCTQANTSVNRGTLSFVKIG